MGRLLFKTKTDLNKTLKDDLMKILIEAEIPLPTGKLLKNDLIEIYLFHLKQQQEEDARKIKAGIPLPMPALSPLPPIKPSFQSPTSPSPPPSIPQIPSFSQIPELPVIPSRAVQIPTSPSRVPSSFVPSPVPPSPAPPSSVPSISPSVVLPSPVQPSSTQPTPYVPEGFRLPTVYQTETEAFKAAPSKYPPYQPVKRNYGNSVLPTITGIPRLPILPKTVTEGQLPPAYTQPPLPASPLSPLPAAPLSVLPLSRPSLPTSFAGKPPSVQTRVPPSIQPRAPPQTTPISQLQTVSSIQTRVPVKVPTQLRK